MELIICLLLVFTPISIFLSGMWISDCLKDILYELKKLNIEE